MVKPKQMSAKDRNNVTNRLRLVGTRWQIIRYKCYATDDHISPGCSANLNNMDLGICNYEELSDEQKALLPNDSYNHSERFLKMKRNPALNTRDSQKTSTLFRKL